MLDVHKGGGRRAGCVVVKEMTVSSASGVESLVRNNFLWSLAFFGHKKMRTLRLPATGGLVNSRI